MGGLEPRFTIIMAIALALAGFGFLLTLVFGGDLWRGLPTSLLLVAFAVVPGVLLGRTGVPSHLGTWVYEGAISYLAGGIVSMGVLVTGTAITAGPVVVPASADVATAIYSSVITTWGPVGVLGYVLGIASTLVEPWG